MRGYPIPWIVLSNDSGSTSTFSDGIHYTRNVLASGALQILNYRPLLSTLIEEALNQLAVTADD